MFEQFKDYDFSNEKKNEIFIDAFVHKVILYDDKVIIIYNYSGDNIQEIKKSEIEEISGISTGSDFEPNGGDAGSCSATMSHWWQCRYHATR